MLELGPLVRMPRHVPRQLSQVSTEALGDQSPCCQRGHGGDHRHHAGERKQQRPRPGGSPDPDKSTDKHNEEQPWQERPEATQPAYKLSFVVNHSLTAILKSSFRTKVSGTRAILNPRGFNNWAGAGLAPDDARPSYFSPAGESLCSGGRVLFQGPHFCSFPGQADPHQTRPPPAVTAAIARSCRSFEIR
jgi:hypothetical protein